MCRAFGGLRRTVQKNLAVLTVAFLRVLGAARGGNGGLSLGALFRVLPTAGTARAREKRLRRFLENPRLDPRGVTDGLARFVFGQRGRGLWPILFDQTQSGSAQALLAGVPFQGRVLPLSVYTFSYPWRERAARSQNQLERVFLLDLEGALPSGVRGVFIGDRGYARAALFRQSEPDGRLFVIRGRAGTLIEYEGRRCKLGELPCTPYRARRYRDVLYQARLRVRVDIVTFHDPAFREPWFLVVPPDSEAILPTDTVVALYRERMQVEHSFRDFKTHLGLRGLKLRVRIAERTGRLLLAFCIAYCLALVLGVSTEAQHARADLEILRRQPRHGTRRTLSVLSVAMQMLSHPRWRSRAYERLQHIAARLAASQRALPRPPPQIEDLTVQVA
ncbi:MAG: transposase [Acidobacteria bacterium]|nr:transposase [Acidobacteriota bacterium]